MSSGSKKMATRNIATTIVARSSLTKKAIMVNKQYSNAFFVSGCILENMDF